MSSLLRGRLQSLRTVWHSATLSSPFVSPFHVGILREFLRLTMSPPSCCFCAGLARLQSPLDRLMYSASIDPALSPCSWANRSLTVLPRRANFHEESSIAPLRRYCLPPQDKTLDGPSLDVRMCRNFFLVGAARLTCSKLAGNSRQQPNCLSLFSTS